MTDNKPRVNLCIACSGDSRRLLCGTVDCLYLCTRKPPGAYCLGGELVQSDVRVIDMIAPVLEEVEGPDGMHVDDVSAPLPYTIVLCEPCWFQ